MADELEYLFIDGACLQGAIEAISKRYFGGARVNIDYRRLAAGLDANNHKQYPHFDKVFYYHCLPLKRKDEKGKDEPEDVYQKRRDEQQAFFDSLSTLDRYHVNQGTMSRRGGRGPEQKQVDTMIAVEMMTHAFRKTVRRATLFTSDLDFKPLLEALGWEGMHTTLWYPKQNVSRDLIFAADSKRVFDIECFFDFYDRDYKVSRPRPSSSFQAEPRPAASYQGDLLREDGQPFLDFDGKTIPAFRDHDNFVVVIPASNRPNHFLHVSHPNLEFLRLYVEERFGNEERAFVAVMA